MLSRPPSFRPWRQDFYGAFFFACLILVFLQGQWSFLMYLLLLVLAAATWLLLKSGLIRLYGYKVEQGALKSLLRAVPAGMISINVPVPGAGDIDAVARCGDQVVAIEVKSWKTWQKKSAWDRYAPDERTKRAVSQVKRLSHRIKAHEAVVWLPRAAPFSSRYRGALVFGGDALFKHLNQSRYYVSDAQSLR